jgi:hypothetical protein
MDPTPLARIMFFLSPSRSNTTSPTVSHHANSAPMSNRFHAKLVLPDVSCDDTFSTQSMYISDAPMSMSEFDSFPTTDSYDSSSSVASPVSSRGASRPSSYDSYASTSTVDSVGILTSNLFFDQTSQMLSDSRLSAIEGNEFETSLLPGYRPTTEPCLFSSTNICAQSAIPYGGAPAGRSTILCVLSCT